MNQIELPALVGDSPLAVLAAIGTLSLVHDFVDSGARLSWTPSNRVPVLTSTVEDVDALVDALATVVAAMPEHVTVPGGPQGFPPPGEAPDKLRVPQGELRGLIDGYAVVSSSQELYSLRRWVSGLVTDLVVDTSGRGAISQFSAPAGKQSMATMLEKTLERVQGDPRVLREAFLGWRRVSGVTGEYLDHRANWDSGEDGRGKADMRGVPGATWLALMSYPLWTVTADGTDVVTSGWHRLRDGRRRVAELRLPLWTEPIGPNGVIALVEHPLLGGPWQAIDEERLSRLGIFAVCRARRRQAIGGKSAGVLVPI